MLATALSLMVLASIVMLGGAWFQWRRGNRKQAALMLVLAAVLAINVAIWAVPGESGQSLAGRESR